MARAGKPRKVPPHIWRLVAQELDAGATYEQVQRDLLESTPSIDVSISRLQAYRAEDARKLRAGRPRESAPEMGATLDRLQARSDARRGKGEPDAAPAAPLPDDADLDTMLRRQIRDCTGRIERARSLGDSKVAASESKNLAELTRLLGSAQRDKAATRDVLTVTRAEIDQAMRSVRDKVAGIVQRPLQCTGCARELAAALTGVDLTPPVVQET